MQDRDHEDHETEVQEGNFLNSLRELQANIDGDIQKMANLKIIYQDTQEKKFLHTFVNIMDHMSNELQRANDLYEEIDKEIASDEQCMYLAKELQYFQNECIELKHTLKRKQNLLSEEKEKEELLRKELHHLQSKLFLETYKEMKYKAKMEEKAKKSKRPLQSSKSNKSYESRSKSIQNRIKSSEVNDALYDEIYKKRSKSLRHATSFRTESRQKLALLLQNKKSANLFATFKQS